jgi:hypothetical protein
MLLLLDAAHVPANAIILNRTAVYPDRGQNCGVSPLYFPKVHRKTLIAIQLVAMTLVIKGFTGF